MSLRGCEGSLLQVPWGQGEQVRRTEKAFPWGQEGPMSKLEARYVKTAGFCVPALGRHSVVLGKNQRGL